MKEFNYAQISKRFISYIIDYIIVTTLFIIIFYKQIQYLVTPEMMRIFLIKNIWVYYLLDVIYQTFFITFYGATAGKFITKTKVVDEDSGNLLPFGRAFLRASVRLIGEIFFYFTFIFAFFDKKVQTLHDKISKCVVINV